MEVFFPSRIESLFFTTYVYAAVLTPFFLQKSPKGARITSKGSKMAFQKNLVFMVLNSRYRYVINQMDTFEENLARLSTKFRIIGSNPVFLIFKKSSIYGCKT